MKNIYEALGIALGIEIDNELFAASGRRNYVIIVRDDSFRVMPFGEAGRKGLLRASLSEIANHKMHWIKFTYKKDLMKVSEALVKLGYTQY